jgi:YYY domain-containing protein
VIFAAAARVWLVFALPGIFAAPLLRRAFPGLNDGGAAIARPVGWLIVTWIAWFLPSLTPIPYGTPLAIVAMSVVAVGGAVVAFLDRKAWREVIRTQWTSIVLGEAIGLAVVAIFTWLMRWNGDVHPLAERFMDYAILARLDHTTSFPPLDSWMAGKTLQYYYYGYVVMDVLRRLASMDLRAFFNLAGPAVYGVFAMGLYGCGRALTGRRVGGVIAFVGGALLANFEFARQIVTTRWSSGQWHFYGLNWFAASRLIPGTINEVPAFSAFWGDLHPYYLGFPFVAAVVCLGIAAFRAETPPFDASRPILDRALALLVLTVPLGALYPTNSWDFPTFAAMIMAAIAIPRLPPMERLGPLADWVSWKKSWRGKLAENRDWIEPLVTDVLAVAVVSVLLYLPFHIGFGRQVGRGIRLAQHRSDAFPMMLQFGPWFLVIVGWALATARTPAERLRRALPVPAAAVVLLVYERYLVASVAGFVKVLAGKGAVLLVLSQGIDHLFLRGLAFVLILASLWSLLGDLEWKQLRTPEGFSRGLVASALGLVLICEFAFLRDFYGGENERMNTVFKAYIQAWILFGVGSAGLVGAIWESLKKRSWTWMAGYAVAGSVTVAASLSFIVLADYTRSNRFTSTRAAPRPTYDPEALFRERYPDDARAVDWIKLNLPADATILEETAHAYEWETRVSTFTGRIGLIGWQNHESGWRNSWDLAMDRANMIKQIYEGTDLDAACAIARRYGMEYIYVGELERDAKKYPGFHLEKFSALEKVYGSDRVALFRVPATDATVAKP